ncbi:hypothetical protein PVK06_013945 [Gossypium arboreum]|uniref:Uncharacterized protein n=1 Tax=Gossypium arboreum TaxID=29729 RepID=A0ABR0PTF2_GOSAR|nr:hypothetical protein PVK06_013945 [Gossypium arboreum]
MDPNPNVLLNDNDHIAVNMHQMGNCTGNRPIFYGTYVPYDDGDSFRGCCKRRFRISLF